MSCAKFCKGGENTGAGLVAISLDQSIFKEKFITKLKKEKTADGRFLCPFGCTHNPDTIKGMENFLRNGGGIHSICHNNPWRYHKIKE